MSKKVLSIILILTLALMSCGGLSGCQTQAKSDEPIRILVDGVHSAEKSEWKRNFTQFMNTMDVPKDYTIEFLRNELTGEDAQAEREARITQLRTEIMAGEGPDIFLMLGGSGLFLTPEKNMALGQFYPLDDFIEKAKYMDWDALTPEVMTGGRSEQYGQVILPMSYSLPVACFKKDDLPEPPAGNSWQDVLADESGFLQASGCLFGAYESEIVGGIYGSNNLACSFGQVADYASSPRQLSFTEEELLQRIQEMFAIEEKAAVNTWGLPEYFTTHICTYFSNSNNSDNYRNHIEGNVDKIPLTMVPQYSDDGGVTAKITTFAAINANTKRAEDAFALLDAMFSPQAALELDLYVSLAVTGAPVFEDMFSPEFAKAYREAHKDKTKMTEAYSFGWDSFSQENFDEFDRIRRQITCTQFSGQIPTELWNLLDDCLTDPENTEQLVHETYQRIRQMLGE